MRRQVRSVLFWLWEAAAALGLYGVFYAIAWSFVMAFAGGPTFFRPHSIAVFAWNWAANAVPDPVQVGLFVMALLFLPGPPLAVLRPRFLLPRRVGGQPGEGGEAAFRRLPAPVRRRLALEEIGDPIESLTIAQRIRLAERLKPELERREKGEERLIEAAERRVRRGMERVERREAARKRRERRMLGGILLEPDEFFLLEKIREQVAEGYSFAALMPRVTERLREAVLAAREAADEALIEILGGEGAMPADGDSESGEARPLSASDAPDEPAAPFPELRREGAAPRVVSRARAMGPGPGEAGAALGPALSALRASGSGAAREADEPAPALKPDPEASQEPEPNAEAEDTEGDEEEPDELWDAGDGPTDWVFGEEGEAPASHLPEAIGVFEGAWDEFKRLQYADELDGGDLGRAWREAKTARLEVTPEALSAADRRGDLEPKLAACDGWAREAQALWDIVCVHDPADDAVWDALVRYGRFWRSHLRAFAEAEGRGAEAARIVERIDKAQEALFLAG